MKFWWFIVICFLASFTSCSKKEVELTYYENGQMETKMEMLEGKLHGISFYYYPNGIIEMKSSWKHGLQDGITEIYYPDGKLKSKETFMEGRLNGLAFEYYNNGQLKKRAFKRNNKTIGEITIFSVEGRPVETRIYDQNGEMIYMAGYDENGLRDIQWPVPHLKIENDTIPLGGTYKTSVSFAYKLRGDVKMLVGVLDTMDVMTDTFAVIKPTEKGEFIYSTKATIPGHNSVSVKFIHKTKELDTLSVHNLAVRHGDYFVKDSI